MPKPRSKRCGKPKKDGKPCKRDIPCPYHGTTPPKGKKQNRSIVRQDKLLQGQLAGKTVQQAGREAGYAESTLRGKIYQIIQSEDYQARIRAALDAARLQTEEIIGRLILTMRSDVAGDLLSETDPMIQRAKELGISDQITEVSYDGKTGALTKIKWKDAQQATIHLSKVFDQEKLPSPIRRVQRDLNASVERLMQNARDAGVTLPEEKLRKRIIEKLTPLYQGLSAMPPTNDET